MFLDETPMEGSVKDYRPFTLKIVNNTDLELLWDESVRRHHYLGFGKMIGQSIKYLVFAKERPIAALSYNRASLRVDVRDIFIDWSDEGRQKYLSHIISNHRFLIFPWIKVKNLASHVLAQSLRAVRADWKTIHGVEPQLVETFIDSSRHKGTCYLAANFKCVGETMGFGRRGKIFEYHGIVKKVFIYELNPNFIKSIEPHMRRGEQQNNLTINVNHKNPKNQIYDKMLLGFKDWNPSILENVGIEPGNIENIDLLLEGYIQQYSHCFTHVAQRRLFRLYLEGLLSDLERKSIEPIALKFGDKNDVRLLQKFSKLSPVLDNELRFTYQRLVAECVSYEDGMFTVGECFNIKKGMFSVGVARQHKGSLGKDENCQVSVAIGYSGLSGYALINSRLYLPLIWMSEEYAPMREKCEIPKDIKYQTKKEIALDLITRVYKDGLFPAKWVGIDADFSYDTKLLDLIPSALYYIANARPTDHFYATFPDPEIAEKPHKGTKPARPHILGKPKEARKIIEESPVCWKKIKYGGDSKGPIKGEEKILRVMDVRKGQANQLIWLYARKWENGRIKYMISNAPEDTTPDKLREVSIRRWAIEQCFEECKSTLGLGHYEGRSWKGWHRHVLFVYIAHLFLQRLKK
ncbi:MAG: IS701 family transposase [Deltaproteobacteria bacterium]|jgi:SRSO17 transposase|nr:IS701 family transposase [Deltaproteobacteria bacterium]